MGPQTIVAGLALFVASALLIYFFVTQNEAADTASNWFYLVFYALMAWTVVDVHRFFVDDVSAIWLMTIVALTDLTVLFVSTLLIVLKRIAFGSVGIVMTAGFLVLMVWMFLASVIVIVKGGMPAALGWFGVAVLMTAVTVVLVTARDRELMVGDKIPGRGLSLVYGAVLVGLTVWIVWLGAAPVYTV